MYLKTVAELGGAAAPVPIAQIASSLEVTPVSAGEMIKRLSQQGLIEHLPYKGAQLTTEGVQAAHSIIRRQRLWECFLVDHLQLNWAGAYEMACRLEHATSNVVAEALSSYLGHPQKCPHGKPIPNQDGQMPQLEGVPLSKLRIGQPARIVAVTNNRTDVLAYLQQRALLPGAQVRIQSVAPMDGPLTLTMDSGSVTIGQALAEFILVQPLTQTEEEPQPESMTLDQLRPGESATILHVGGQGPRRRRFLEMGLVRGEQIRAERVAPLGDPVEYCLKGYHLSLRHDEARQIQITRD
jgi:DtxR family Mn-dependent transcriptional regulator